MKDNHIRKVLFISYLFPPAGGGGVQRSSKFVKYLPSFGWMPLVLTVKEPYDFYNDNSLLDDVTLNCKIYRTHSVEPMKCIRKFLKKKSQKKTSREKDFNNRSFKTLKPGFLVKLKTYLLIPDNEILWLPFAVWKGWQIIRKEHPAVIYSSASPFTDHLIAVLLSKIFKLPCVLDFRDLWVDRPNFPKNKMRLWIDRKLERFVIKNADQIITATPLMTEHFKDLYPDKNFTTITNGFDEDDFLTVQEVKPPENEFRIIYTGIFNAEQNPHKIFLALKKITDERTDIRDKIKIKFIGQLDNPGDFQNYTLFKKLGLDKYSDLISYQPHKQVVSEMSGASVLLLLIGEYPHSRTVLTGKIFEYLRSGRPILAVVPVNGIAADIIRKTNSGIVAANNDVDEIADGFLKLFDLFSNNELENSFTRKNIKDYDRKYLTGKLSDVLNNIVN